MATFGALSPITFGGLFGPSTSSHTFADFGIGTSIVTVEAVMTIDLKEQQSISLTEMSTLLLTERSTITLVKETL